MSRIFIATALSLVASVSCFAHSGGLDRQGGHHSASGYHFHGGGGGGESSGLFGAPDASAIAAELAMQRRAAFQAQQIVLAQRTSARDSARTAARVAARGQAKSDTSQPAKFHFHHAKQDPYIVAGFTENKDQWECLLAKGFKVNLKKDVIVRIEPIDDPTDLRTWKDSTGEHSVVARYHAFTDPSVELVDMASKLIKINVHILSSYDQQHLYNKILHPDNPVTAK